MKKKYRDITIDNKQYAWQVKDNPMGKELVIWYNKVIISSSDVSNITTVTPKYVSDVIKLIERFEKISPVNQSDNSYINNNNDFMMKL
jgi:hypothetical protein